MADEKPIASLIFYILLCPTLLLLARLCSLLQCSGCVQSKNEVAPLFFKVEVNNLANEGRKVTALISYLTHLGITLLSWIYNASGIDAKSANLVG